MKNKKNNEELQSRRQFFKQAAKGALPIIAATVLASAPAIVKAAGVSGCQNCYKGCVGGCTACTSCTSCTGCSGSCYLSCTCCQGTCRDTCGGSARGY